MCHAPDSFQIPRKNNVPVPVLAWTHCSSSTIGKEVMIITKQLMDISRKLNLILLPTTPDLDAGHEAAHVPERFGTTERVSARPLYVDKIAV